MNDTKASAHQLPVNLKTTKGRQSPLCIQQACQLPDVVIPSGIYAVQRYVRPPIRTRQCCSGPSPTESVAYFTTTTTIPIV